MLDLLRLFVQVVEEQSFTATARRLGISQPAVSNQIRVLEEKLGVELIYRKGKGLALTPEGELVFRHATRILAEWGELLHRLEGSSQEISGWVHIGASHIPGEYLLPFTLAGFRAKYPLVSFKIQVGDSSEMADKVLNQEVDFAVVGSAFDTEKLTSEFWLEDELILVVAAGHPLGRQSSIKIQDLAEYPMIIRESGSGHRRALESSLNKYGLHLEDFQIALEMGSSEAIKNAVRAGLGYSFISRSALNSCLNKGLETYAIEDFRILRGFYLLTRRNKELSCASRACYNYLLEESKNKQNS